MNTCASLGTVTRAYAVQRVHATLDRLSQAGRRFEDLDSMLEDLAGVIADAVGVGRLMVFLRHPGDETFELRYAQGHYADVIDPSYSETDELPLWLEFHAHAVCRSTLSALVPLDEQVMLRGVLNAFASEALVPLFGRRELLGWLLVGKHASGRCFTEEDLEDLQTLAQHVAITLENAMLHKVVGEQRALTQAMIAHLAEGVVAIDPNGTLRWINQRTADILALSGTPRIGQPVEQLGSQAADAIRACLTGGGGEIERNWEEPATLHPISITVRPFENDGKKLGALAVLRDQYREARLRREEARVERKAFYQGLADAVGHEVRNACTSLVLPLHALRTTESIDSAIADLADGASQRLEELPNLFDRVANTQGPVFQPCRMRGVLEEAIRRTTRELDQSACPVQLSCPPGLPVLEGDHGLLVECFGQLLANGMEALAGRPEPRIRVCVQTKGRTGNHLQILVEDNGPGLQKKVRKDPFSPFATNKCWPGAGERHIGLGLPLVQRIVLDHDGQVSLDTSPRGTQVFVLLPLRQADDVGRDAEQAGQSDISPSAARPGASPPVAVA